jgi:NAD(P)-dependent dehydrogenase (short-subunit alcohol dehydrogenase family)
MNSLFSLSGKTVLVTGASSGLGAHFAPVLARAGASLILAARRQSALEETAEAARALGAAVTVVPVDVTSAASVAALAPAIAQVDVLINNAGIVRSAPALAQTEEDWDTVIDTNLKGMFLLAQAAARAMKAHGRGGAIVNIASILGLRQAGGVAPYAISKAGVVQMTKTLALELARYNIRVNALAPGYLDTALNREFWETETGQALIKRIPARRLGQPAELDGPLLLLASEASAYMSGAVLAVDGGHLVNTL